MSAHAVPALRPPVVLRATQALLGLMGAVVIFGSVYFSAIDPPQRLHAVDWAVGAWAFALGVALLLVAARIGSGDAGVRRVALRLLALHAVFGLVKIVGYHESAGFTFMAVDALLIGLLNLPAVRRYSR
jgi:hypothetical protein